jgi:hypothetical protein
MSLTDLLNPTFFMCLGIVLLAIALLVVYFENKMREQNHKISSMLSLVSTLAEDMNGFKIGLNHLAINSMGGGTVYAQPQQFDELNTAFISNNDHKITVSDDEDEGSVDDSENDSESEILGDEIDSVSDDESVSDDVKVLKLNFNKEDLEEDDDDASETMDFDDNMEDLDQLDELEDTNSETSNVNSEFVAETLDLNYEENFESQPGEQGNTDEHVENISTSDLKKININLEETNSESLDYKKLPLPKLRNIVAEKGLTLDTSKLKKHELLKLLECE